MAGHDKGEPHQSIFKYKMLSVRFPKIMGNVSKNSNEMLISQESQMVSGSDEVNIHKRVHGHGPRLH